MGRSGDHRIGHGADGFGGRLPVCWQDWATIGIFIGFLAAAQLLIPRSSAAYVPALGVGGALFLALCVRRTRLGRRWLDRLKAALADEPVRGSGGRKTGRSGREKR